MASPRIMRVDGSSKALARPREEGKKKTSFSILDERVIRKAIEKSSYYILQLLQLANVHSKRSKHEIKEEDEYGISAHSKVPWRRLRYLVSLRLKCHNMSSDGCISYLRW